MPVTQIFDQVARIAQFESRARPLAIRRDFYYGMAARPAYHRWLGTSLHLIHRFEIKTDCVVELYETSQCSQAWTEPSSNAP